MSKFLQPCDIFVPHFLPVVQEWVIKGFDMSSRVYTTGHIKDPMPLIEKIRASCPVGVSPSFIHQNLIIIIAGPNTLYDCMFSP